MHRTEIVLVHVHDFSHLLWHQEMFADKTWLSVHELAGSSWYLQGYAVHFKGDLVDHRAPELGVQRYNFIQMLRRDQLWEIQPPEPGPANDRYFEALRKFAYPELYPAAK